MLGSARLAIGVVNLFDDVVRGLASGAMQWTANQAQFERDYRTYRYSINWSEWTAAREWNQASICQRSTEVAFIAKAITMCRLQDMPRDYDAI
jgi:hypothetical protein